MTADSATLGKTAGKDLLVDKVAMTLLLNTKPLNPRPLTRIQATYPKLMGLEESRKRADALIAEAKEQIAPWGDKV